MTSPIRSVVLNLPLWIISVLNQAIDYYSATVPHREYPPLRGRATLTSRPSTHTTVPHTTAAAASSVASGLRRRVHDWTFPLTSNYTLVSRLYVFLFGYGQQLQFNFVRKWVILPSYCSFLGNLTRVGLKLGPRLLREPALFSMQCVAAVTLWIHWSGMPAGRNFITLSHLRGFDMFF